VPVWIFVAGPYRHDSDVPGSTVPHPVNSDDDDDYVMLCYVIALYMIIYVHNYDVGLEAYIAIPIITLYYHMIIS